MRGITARGSERQMRLQDVFGVDIRNLLALRLFLNAFLSGYRKHLHLNTLDFPRTQSPGPTPRVDLR